MPTFDTPSPISATIDLVVGDVRITAGDRDTTVVEVRPSDASNDEDRKAAEQTRVEYAGDAAAGQGAEAALVAAAQRRRLDRRDDRAARRLERARRRGQLADFHCDGRLGDCRIKTGLGRIRLEQAGR